MVLFHPGPASIDCNDCAKWIYDLDTGKKQTHRAGPTLEERPNVRPASVPPPCEKCPKKSPENAERLRLSDKNLRTFDLYKLHRATPFRNLDATTRRNFAHLDELFRCRDRDHLAITIVAHGAKVTVR